MNLNEYIDSVIIFSSLNATAAEIEKRIIFANALSQYIQVYVVQFSAINCISLESKSNNQLCIITLPLNYDDTILHQFDLWFRNFATRNTLYWLEDESTTKLLKNQVVRYLLYHLKGKNEDNFFLSKAELNLLDNADFCIANTSTSKKLLASEIQYNEKKLLIEDKDYPSAEKFFSWIRDSENVASETKINSLPTNQVLDILIIYDALSTFSTPIKESLQDFLAYSRHNIYYLPATQNLAIYENLNNYAVIISHYSIRLSIKNGDSTYSEAYCKALKNFKGFKVAWLQDEYEYTANAISWFKEIGYNLILTCIPQKYLPNVYPLSQFPNTEFITVLTGYVSDSMQKKAENWHIPLEKRKNSIVYRGRILPYWYGTLGNEKYQIGKKFKEICLKNGIPHDIEVDDTKRIYGDDWYKFLANSKVTLGTESGSHIFDYTGEISAYIRNELALNPGLSFQQLFDSYLYQFETDRIKMNQISPKIFESIALRVGLVLFEGEYSNIVEPNIHYIPLKKDFSNIRDVLAKVNDNEFLCAMTERAHNDIIENQKCTSAYMINQLDDYFESKVPGLRKEKIMGDFPDNLSNQLSYASKKIYYYDRAKKQIIEAKSL